MYEDQFNRTWITGFYKPQKSKLAAYGHEENTYKGKMNDEDSLTIETSYYLRKNSKNEKISKEDYKKEAAFNRDAKRKYFDGLPGWEKM